MEDTFGKKNKRDSHSLARTKATEYQWKMVDMAIKEFIREYPLEWIAFLKLNKMSQEGQDRAEWTKAGKSDPLRKKLNWRLAASFPTFMGDDGRPSSVLLDTIEKIIPKLTHTDSVNFKPFLERYPMFKAHKKV